MPIRDLQGSRDDPLLVRNLRIAFEKLEKLKAADAKLIEFPELGHSFRMDVVDWREFFGKARRVAVPKKVVRVFANKQENRAFWLEVVSADRTVMENFRLRLKESEMKSWEKKGLHFLFIAEAEKRSGRIEAEMLEPGRFQVKGRGVRKARLLLSEAMLSGPKVEVVFNGRTRKIAVARSKAVLCVEFAERFDPGFLPVAEVQLR
jgi:hypothetical protein